MASNVQATFSYFNFQPCHKIEKPYEILINLPKNSESVPRSNFAFKDAECAVLDVRGKENDFSLDRNGFTWKKHGTKCDDLKDREVIETKYLPEMEAFIRGNIEGDIKKVHFFDWRLRASMDEEQFSKKTIDLEDGLDPLLPSVHPHIDQSSVGAIKRCRFHLPEEADELMRGRFRIINVWRPLVPIRSWPLAVCDARSVDQRDIIYNDLVRRKYVGESCFGTYNPLHKWYYLKSQNVDEVTMMKIYDSSTDAGAKFCLHSSFKTSDEDTEIVRESLEIRALVFDYPEKGV